MLLACVYKLNPSESQLATLGRWIHLLRLQYNYRLREKIEAFERKNLGAKNRPKTNQRVARLKNQVAIRREYWQGKAAQGLVRKFYLVEFEDLNIQGEFS